MNQPSPDFWPHFQGQPMSEKQISIEIACLGWRTFDLLQAEEQHYVEPDDPNHVAKMLAILDQES